MWYNPSITEKILNNSNYSDIEYLLNEIFNIELDIESLLKINIEKDNPIEDENDYEISLLKVDKSFDLNTWNLCLEYEKIILEQDLKDKISNYLKLLKGLLNIFEWSIFLLKKKVTDDYSLLYKLKTLDIFENLYNNDNIWDSELHELKEELSKNPYKVILKEYNHFYSLILILYNNINSNSNDIFSKWNLISAWLPISLWDIENLKTWEDNI